MAKYKIHYEHCDINGTIEDTSTIVEASTIDEAIRIYNRQKRERGEAVYCFDMLLKNTADKIIEYSQLDYENAEDETLTAEKIS